MQFCFVYSVPRLIVEKIEKIIEELSLEENVCDDLPTVFFLFSKKTEIFQENFCQLDNNLMIIHLLHHMSRLPKILNN